MRFTLRKLRDSIPSMVERMAVKITASGTNIPRIPAPTHRTARNTIICPNVTPRSPFPPSHRWSFHDRDTLFSCHRTHSSNLSAHVDRILFVQLWNSIILGFSGPSLPNSFDAEISHHAPCIAQKQLPLLLQCSTRTTTAKRVIDTMEISMTTHTAYFATRPSFHVTLIVIKYRSGRANPTRITPKRIGGIYSVAG